MEVYKENSCYIKLHQMTLLITWEETNDQSQRRRRDSRVAVWKTLTNLKLNHSRH